MKKVLVIVVTYNGKPWLERCLSSVSVSPKSTGNLEADLFVVDNDSTDGSADYVAAHFPSAKLVRSAENLGFSKANNLGFEWALKKGYDYVYLLNQDAWLAPGALELLVFTAETHPEYAVLSPLQYQDGYQELDAQFARCLSSCTKKGPVVPVQFIMAAHWMVPVAALSKIGPFNEDLFPLYGQDDDWCHRVHYHGLEVVVVPAAKAVHDRAKRAESKEKIMHRNYYTGSLVRLCDINRPLWERFCFVCLFTLVKAVKYHSFKPFKLFADICRRLPEVRVHRRRCL